MVGHIQSSMGYFGVEPQKLEPNQEPGVAPSIVALVGDPIAQPSGSL